MSIRVSPNLCIYKHVVDEDIEVLRMRRLELVKTRSAKNPIAEDGSGWVTLSAKRKTPPSPDMSPPRRRRRSSPDQDDEGGPRVTVDQDISDALAPSKERPKTGLISGREMRDDILRTRKEDLLRFEQMDPSLSGKGAKPVYRDKKGNRISSEEYYFKLYQKVEEKPKEIKIEWAKGLAQKREAESKLLELELEKEKPFARTRDDADLDTMLRERERWGDPMAHLAKKKYSQVVLPDLRENEKMKECGFIIPQDIPSHSWIKIGLEACPNRCSIRPGRHWDGVDRSTGFEKHIFKKTNEKEATEREKYLWSVSDMQCPEKHCHRSSLSPRRRRNKCLRNGL